MDTVWRLMVINLLVGVVYSGEDLLKGGSETQNPGKDHKVLNKALPYFTKRVLPAIPDCLTSDPIDSSKCFSCNPLLFEYIGSPDFKCLPYCQLNEYRNGISCSSCSPVCRSCSTSGDSSCKTCYPGYFFEAGTCYPVCNSNEYLDRASRACVQCPKYCSSCSSTSCSACISGFQLSNGNCLKVCGEGLYLDTPINDCKQCHYSCKTCTGRLESECLDCRNGLSKSSGLCKKQNCNPGGQQCSYQCTLDGYLTTSCTLCNPSCSKCSGSSTSCTACKRGTYLSGASCPSCPTQCSQCSSSTSCSDCYFDYYLSSTSCVAKLTTTANPGKFINTNLVEGSCSQNCQTCTSTSTTCSACSAGFTILATTPGQVCAPTSPCKANQYFAAGASCLNCNLPCTSCLDATTSKCQSCSDNYYLSGSSCASCDGACERCTGPFNSQCSKCKDGYYLAATTCLPCPTGCTNCTASNICTACGPVYILNSSSCWITCSGTAFQSSRTTCSSCRNGCLACSDYNTCSSCASGFSIKGGLNYCTSDCPTKQYWQSGSCLPCHASCKECLSGGQFNCSECDSPLTLVQGGCFDINCASGFNFSETDLTCKPCLSNCSTCEYNALSSCLSCDVTQYFFSPSSKSCVSKICPPGPYYFNETAESCLGCDPSCMTCDYNQASTCLSCANGLFLNEALSTCEKCNEACSTCVKGAGPSSCLICSSLYTPLNPPKDLSAQKSQTITCELACKNGSKVIDNKCLVVLDINSTYDSTRNVITVKWNSSVESVDLVGKFSISLLTSSGSVFSDVQFGDPVLGIERNSFSFSVELSGDIINGECHVSHTAKNQTILLNSKAFVDPETKIIIKNVTKYTNSIANSINQTSQMLSSIIGPSAGAAIAVGTPLSASSGTLLQKLANFFEYLIYLNGRKVVLPQTILEAVGQSEDLFPPSNYLEIDESSIECSTQENYLDNDVSCNVLNNFGQNLVMLSIYLLLISIVSFIYFCSQRVKKPQSFFVRASKAVYELLGPPYFLTIFEGSNMDIAGFSLINFFYMNKTPAQVLGFFVSLCLMVGNLLIAFFGFKFIRGFSTEYKKISEDYSQMIKRHKEQKPTSKELLKKQEEEIEAFERTFEERKKSVRFSAFRFLLEGYRPGLGSFYIYLPIFTIAKNVVCQLVVLLLVEQGMRQVLAVFLVNTVYTLVLVIRPVKQDMVENVVAVLTAVLTESYILMVLFVNRESVDEQTAQFKYGPIMAINLIIIVLINVLFIVFVMIKMIWGLAIEVHRFFQKKNRVASKKIDADKIAKNVNEKSIERDPKESDSSLIGLNAQMNGDRKKIDEDQIFDDKSSEIWGEVPKKPVTFKISEIPKKVTTAQVSNLKKSTIENVKRNPDFVNGKRILSNKQSKSSIPSKSNIPETKSSKKDEPAFSEEKPDDADIFPSVITNKKRLGASEQNQMVGASPVERNTLDKKNPFESREAKVQPNRPRGPFKNPFI